MASEVAMKPHASPKPDLTLEHALAATIARRVTDGTGDAFTCRAMAYEAALEGFRIGVATAAQVLAEMAADEDSKLLRKAERHVRALPSERA